MDTPNLAAPPTLLDGLASIAPRYDVLFVDVWGVVHNGRRPFMAAIEACRQFRRARGAVVLVSNSPRPGARIPDQFDEIGVPTDFYDVIVTSGDATRAELVRRAPGPAFKIGPDRDDRLYDGLGLSFAPEETASFVSCTGLFHDETETPEDYRALLERLAARDLELVCANPDRQFRRGDRLHYAAGALADLYEALSGRVVLCGKPHPPIYRLALDHAARVLGERVSPRRVLAIGDGPQTDLEGAARQGMDALFVAAGIHLDELLIEGVMNADAVAQLLERYGSRAAFATRELMW